MSFDPAILFFSMLISSVGLGLFVYGRKQVRPPQLAVGLALMVYPYFVSTLQSLLGVAALLLGALWLGLRLGW